MLKKITGIIMTVLMTTTVSTLNIAAEGVLCNETQCTHAAAIGDIHYDSLQEAAASSAMFSLYGLIYIDQKMSESYIPSEAAARKLVVNTSVI